MLRLLVEHSLKSIRRYRLTTLYIVAGIALSAAHPPFAFYKTRVMALMQSQDATHAPPRTTDPSRFQLDFGESPLTISFHVARIAIAGWLAFLDAFWDARSRIKEWALIRLYGGYPSLVAGFQYFYLALLGALIECMGSEPAKLGSLSRRRFRRHSVHLVPQSLPLCSQLDAFHNVLLARRMQGKTLPANCHRILSELGMQNRLGFYPSNLSVGESQRVCIARGLATEVPLLLIDEPTTNLDDGYVSMLVKLFREAKNAGRSLIVVTNDSRLTHLADHVIFLNFAGTDA
jgi:alpha-D-ribose 1-methylphosphonate 5-triphosphate synthase subunit PhnL